MKLAIDRSQDELLLQWLEKKTVAPDDIAAKVVGIFSKPGEGKTVLATRLGQRHAVFTDELNGLSSLSNHPELKDRVRAIPFHSWDRTRRIIPLIEEGKFVHFDGESFDNIIFDTVTGMVSHEIQEIVRSGVATEKGKVSAEVAGRPDYLVSEQRIIPLMAEIANLQRCSVVMLSHLRVGDKLTPGDNTRLDVHAAAFRIINKYTSVIAYLEVVGKNERRLQVMPTGNGVSVKTRYRFPSEFVSDDEFVAHIEEWKGKN